MRLRTCIIRRKERSAFSSASIVSCSVVGWPLPRVAIARSASFWRWFTCASESLSTSPKLAFLGAAAGAGSPTAGVGSAVPMRVTSIDPAPKLAADLEGHVGEPLGGVHDLDVRLVGARRGGEIDHLENGVHVGIGDVALRVGVGMPGVVDEPR